MPMDWPVVEANIHNPASPKTRGGDEARIGKAPRMAGHHGAESQKQAGGWSSSSRQRVRRQARSG